MSTLFREETHEEPITPVKEEEPNIYGTEEDVEDIRPVESDQDILRALGIADDLKVLPEDDFQDLQELKGYLYSYMEEKGLPKTFRGLKNGIESLKEQMELHEEADPQMVIKKIGGIAKSWKALSFVSDVKDRKKILFKLVKATTPKEMDAIVFEEMTKRELWR